MDASGFVRISVLLVVVALFIIFILLDAWKAVNRKAHWVPSHFLVLSALIIQLLNLLSGKSALEKDAWDEEGNLKKNALWMIHSSRVMLCVVMAYLLPSMAARGSQEFWGKMAALGITILGQMTSELYTVNSYVDSSLSTLLSLWPGKRGSNELLFIGSAAILSISFVTLILLLGCANIASRGIQVIFAQKIPLILLTPKTADEKKWKTIEDEVLKAWIVARAYTPEYIIARSALSSSAAAILSLLIWSSITGWLLQGPTVETPATVDKLKLMVTILQVIFILIGWAIMAWRCAIAAGYYTRWHSGTWRTVCKVEDYWTRYIKDLIQDRKAKFLEAERLNKKVAKLIAKQPTTNQMPQMLLYVLEGLQWITVLFSKLCWMISLIIFHNKCTSKLMALVLFKHDENQFEKFPNYEEILEGLDMLGETAKSLWIANRKSIAKARELITQGHLDGETSCKELVALLKCRKKQEGIDLSNFNTEKATGFNYLWQATVDKPLEVEKQFVEATKTSWKMTAVSLIRIIIQLSPMCNCSECPGASESTSEAASHNFPPKEVMDSLKTYSQAWEILDFVDALEGDGIIAEAADTFFLELRSKVEKGDLPPKRIFHFNAKCVETAINEIAMEGQKKADKPRGLNIMSVLTDKLGLRSKTENPKPGCEDQECVGTYDSMNWKRVAAGTAVYRLCKSIGNSPNAKELFKELQGALADIIYGSITKAKSTLVSNSRIWAKDSDENKIGRALYTAGKAKALMKMDKRTTNQTSIQCLENFPSCSEKAETNPPDAYGLEIVPSTC